MSQSSSRQSYLHGDRRRFLRGLGGTALSLPAFASLAGTCEGSPLTSPAQRMAIFYVPIGVIRRGFFPGESDVELVKFGASTKIHHGAQMQAGLHELTWTPTLEPLRPLAEKITLVTGLDRVFQNGTDVHAQCASCFLSSAEPFTVSQSAWPLQRTLDQIIGDHVGQETAFRTLEISCNSHRDNKESIYFDNISWYGTGHVAPSIRDPRKLYNRLFGTSDVRKTKDITDLVLDDANDLSRHLGADDRRKFEEYFQSIRDIERQIVKLEQLKSNLQQTDIPVPVASQLPRGEYIRMMGDLMIAALHSGITNVATLMVGPERWDTPLTYEGLFDRPMSHHQMSHNPGKFADELLKLDLFHMEQFAYLAGRMNQITEVDGSTLLDNTFFTFGSGLGDGSTHQYNDLPIIVAGSGGGRITNGRHLHCENGTPLANLWLLQARAMGLPLENFADSRGSLSQIELSA